MAHGAHFPAELLVACLDNCRHARLEGFSGTLWGHRHQGGSEAWDAKMLRIGKLGVALAVVLGAGFAALAPAAAQPAVLEAGKDCQKFRTCDYRRGGSYLGCRVSYACKVCRFVSANCTVDGQRKVCQRLKCGFGPVS